MKKILTVLLLGLLYGTSAAQWNFVSRPSGATISSVSVASQTVIWIACDSTKVFRTTDAGNTWALRNTGLPSGNMYGISALDDLNCWVGTVGGSIYRTTNGGTSWTLQFSQPGSFSDGIKMFNQNYGIYYGDPTSTGQPFQIRYTTNGGTNWNLSPNVPLSQNDYGVINAWDWIDTSRVWFGVANATPNATSSRIFRTSTGVASGNWSVTALPGTGTPDGMYFQAVAFINASSGMVGTNGGQLRRTTDGGATWSLVPNPPGITNAAMVALNAIKDGSNIIRLTTISSSVPKMFRTTNLGTSWTEETLPSQVLTSKINHVQFWSQTLGYAGADNGWFLRYGNPSNVSAVNNLLPSEYSLEQNYPNPFNPSTRISFSIPFAGEVSLKVYDIDGREVAVLMNEYKEAGNYSYEFGATSQLSSGAYFYVLASGDFRESKMMILAK